MHCCMRDPLYESPGFRSNYPLMLRNLPLGGGDLQTLSALRGAAIALRYLFQVVHGRKDTHIVQKNKIIRSLFRSGRNNSKSKIIIVIPSLVRGIFRLRKPNYLLC